MKFWHTYISCYVYLRIITCVPISLGGGDVPVETECFTFGSCFGDSTLTTGVGTSSLGVFSLATGGMGEVGISLRGEVEQETKWRVCGCVWAGGAGCRVSLGGGGVSLGGEQPTAVLDTFLFLLLLLRGRVRGDDGGVGVELHGNFDWRRSLVVAEWRTSDRLSSSLLSPSDNIIAF